MVEIQISYKSKPQGQLGVRPQQIRHNETCRITSPDAGDLVVEFTGRSPLSNGTTIKRDTDFVPNSSGRFPFNCVFTPPGGQPMKIDGGDLLCVCAIWTARKDVGGLCRI